MKNYLKNELKHLPMIIIVSIIFCGINTLANNHLFNSKDVDYDNSNSHIESTNVGDAIDELFNAANNFTTYDTRLQGVETKVGTGSLNTTAQTLIGGVNELNGKITNSGIIRDDKFSGGSKSYASGQVISSEKVNKGLYLAVFTPGYCITTGTIQLSASNGTSSLRVAMVTLQSGWPGSVVGLFNIPDDTYTIYLVAASTVAWQDNHSDFTVVKLLDD